MLSKYVEHAELTRHSTRGVSQVSSNTTRVMKMHFLGS